MPDRGLQTAAHHESSSHSLPVAFSPYQPNQSRNTPSRVSAALWPGMSTGLPAASKRPMRGPRILAATKLAMPPTWEAASGSQSPFNPTAVQKPSSANRGRAARTQQPRPESRHPLASLFPLLIPSPSPHHVHRPVACKVIHSAVEQQHVSGAAGGFGAVGTHPAPGRPHPAKEGRVGSSCC